MKTFQNPSQTHRNNYYLKVFYGILILSFILTETIQANNTTYYLTAGKATNAEEPASWNTSLNGGGTAATNFSTDGDIFIIPNGINAGISTNFVFGNLSGNCTVTLDIMGSLSLYENAQLILQQGGSSTSTIVNVYDGGSAIFAGKSTNQLIGVLSLQANKSKIQLNLLKGANLKTANEKGILSGDGNSSINSTYLTANLNVAANYEFSGVTQTTAGLPSTVNDLTFSGNGAKTLSTATTVNGIFSIENGSYNNTYADNLAYGAAATLQYNAGASNRTVGDEWETPFKGTGGIIIKGSGTIALNLSKQIGNNTNIPLNINHEAVLVTNNYRLTFHGNFINDGTLIAGSSQIIISGNATTQSIGTFTTTGAVSVTKTAGIATLTGNIGASSLNISSSASLMVAPTKTLTITGTITNNGILTLQSNSIGTATLLDNGLTGTGKFNVQQYLTGTGNASPSGRGWYISSPVNNATRNIFTATGNTLWNWDEASQAYFTIADGSTLLKPMEGYVTRAGANAIVTFSGSCFNSGICRNIVLTRTGTTHINRGYNLIGNPYPSFLNWDGATKSNILPTIWYRTFNGSQMVFDTYNGIVGTNNSGNGPISQYIPPMQAFWVLVDRDGNTGSIEFNNSIRSHQSNNLLRSMTQSNIPLLRLEVTNGTNRDETIILFSASASDSIDNQDSPKMANNIDSVPEIFTYAGSQQVAINSLNNYSSGKTLALGFKTGLSGSFAIKASEIENFVQGTSIILTDKLLNRQQDLAESPTYSFSSETTNSSDRFAIVINQIPTTQINPVSSPAFIAFDNGDGTIRVDLKNPENKNTVLSLYTISGQRLLTRKAEGATITIGSNLQKGFYMLEIDRDGYRIVKKVVINH
jgi:hypothetical protein